MAVHTRTRRSVAASVGALLVTLVAGTALTVAEPSAYSDTILVRHDAGVDGVPSAAKAAPRPTPTRTPNRTPMAVRAGPAPTAGRQVVQGSGPVSVSIDRATRDGASQLSVG